MKKIYLFIVTLFSIVNYANAQLYVEGDITKDGNVNVQDVTKLVNIITGKEAKQTAESLLEGTWYNRENKSIHFDVNGNTDISGASRFKYDNVNNVLRLYDISNKPIENVDIVKISPVYLVLRYPFQNDTQTYFRRELFVESIEFPSTSIAINQNETYHPTPYITPETAFTHSLLWTSSNPSVATVDAQGNIIGVNPGLCTLTARPADGSDVSASIDVTVRKPHTISFDISKTDWATIGNPEGESIGTVTSDVTNIDHYRFEIKCKEDPEQFISFNDLYAQSGNIVCTSFENGSYTLNKGYHYTLYIYAYDVPYYGVEPVCTTQYEFVGTGVAPILYNEDIKVVGINLKANSFGLGYDMNGNTFDITFSAPVAKVVAFWAQGLYGSTNFVATPKNAERTVWTITMSDDISSAEGSINVNIVAYDNNGLELRAANDVHPYAFNIVANLTIDQ